MSSLAIKHVISKEDSTRVLAEYLNRNLKTAFNKENPFAPTTRAGFGGAMGVNAVIRYAESLFLESAGGKLLDCQLYGSLIKALGLSPSNVDKGNGLGFNSEAIKGLVRDSLLWLSQNKPNRTGAVSNGVYSIEDNNIIIKNISNIKKSDDRFDCGVVISCISIHSGGHCVSVRLASSERASVEFDYLMTEVAKHV
jgi:hypothetical protein